MEYPVIWRFVSNFSLQKYIIPKSRRLFSNLLDKGNLTRLPVIVFMFGSIMLNAQNPLLVLEAENAELTLPSKVKYVSGYSGDAYVGDNDPGSSMLFKDVYVENEGTYEFRTFYTSMNLRSVAVQSGYFPEVISNCPKETEDWNKPPVEEMITYIYLDEGSNAIRIFPYNDGGPNIDKFEIWETSVAMPRPVIRKRSFSYDLTDDAIISINGIDQTSSVINDNDEFSVYEFNEASVEIDIECDMPYLLTGYLLSAGPDKDIDVENWELEYSPDGDNYFSVTPSQHKDLSTASKFLIDRSSNENPDKASKFYRLTAQGGAVGEIQLFGIPFLSNNDGKSFPIDIAEGVSFTSKVFGNPLGTYSSFADERYFNLFDRDMATKFYWGNGTVFEVEIELESNYNLSYYTITSCQDFPERDPKAWIVEGFDKDWEVVSEVNDFYFPCRYATMKFSTNSNKSYKGFRLRSAENNGAEGFQLLKWQLFGVSEVANSLQLNQQNEVKIFSDWGNLIIDSQKTAYCRIVDISGRLIKEMELNAERHQIPLSAGVYVIKVFFGQQSVTNKVIIK